MHFIDCRWKGLLKDSSVSAAISSLSPVVGPGTMSELVQQLLPPSQFKGTGISCISTPLPILLQALHTSPCWPCVLCSLLFFSLYFYFYGA